LKTDIHPEVFETKVSCSGCGVEFVTSSTISEIRVEVCSECHPFFTGKQARIVDSEGRVEKFIKKFEGKSTRVSKRKRRQETAAGKRMEEAKKEKEREAKQIEKKNLSSQQDTVQENKSEEDVSSTK
tara:strand:+ start:2050 stop:2430 length:381 start_codon:yes stop_codon:yes gene_type:complete